MGKENSVMGFQLSKGHIDACKRGVPSVLMAYAPNYQKKASSEEIMAFAKSIGIPA